jgi:flagellar hook assembly protein FlgD
LAASRRATLAAVLFSVLAIATVGAFAATRALRSQDDVLNTVRLPDRIVPGTAAPIDFSLTQADGDADVLIIDRHGDAVRSLQSGTAISSGPHEVEWDGEGDDGEPVAPGRYRLRVVLDEDGRSIEPPGSMLIEREEP